MVDEDDGVESVLRADGGGEPLPAPDIARRAGHTRQRHEEPRQPKGSCHKLTPHSRATARAPEPKLLTMSQLSVTDTARDTRHTAPNSNFSYYISRAAREILYSPVPLARQLSFETRRARRVPHIAMLKGRKPPRTSEELRYSTRRNAR